MHALWHSNPSLHRMSLFCPGNSQYPNPVSYQNRSWVFCTIWNLLTWCGCAAYCLSSWAASISSDGIADMSSRQTARQHHLLLSKNCDTTCQSSCGIHSGWCTPASFIASCNAVYTCATWQKSSFWILAQKTASWSKKDSSFGCPACFAMHASQCSQVNVLSMMFDLLKGGYLQEINPCQFLVTRKGGACTFWQLALRCSCLESHWDNGHHAGALFMAYICNHTCRISIQISEV